MSGLGLGLESLIAKLAISGLVTIFMLTAWVIALYVWIMLRLETADSGRWSHLREPGFAVLVSPSKCIHAILCVLKVDPASVEDAHLAWGLRFLRLTYLFSVPIVMAVMIGQLLSRI